MALPDPPAHMFICDPGLLSGIAELTWDKETRTLSVAHSGEVSFDDVGLALSVFVNKYGPEEAEVVAERFTITRKTAENSQAPWSLEIIGMMRWIVASAWHRDYETSILLQQPAQAMSTCPNPILRAAGLWHRGGAGHARDALRHGLFRYALLGVRDVWENLSATHADDE